jgi:copper chaperone CopZ
MEKLQLNVPDMYADHHVLKVRAVLAGLGPGVQNVIASSAFRMLAVEHDPAVISAEAMKAALAEAGYPVSPRPAMVNPVVPGVPVATGHGDPAWERLGVRISRTDARDAKPGR